VQQLRLIWRDPTLRMVAGLMALQGALLCTFGPFVSVLAVRSFGLGDAGYAAVMFTSTLVAVTSALYSGIRADQTANRRGIALFAGAVIVAGVSAMTFLPSTPSFVLAHALLLPANSLFGQLFAQARLATAHLSPTQRDSIQSTIRALLALPFVVILPLWSLAFEHGVPVMAIYPVGLVVGVTMLTLIWTGWPSKGAMAGRDVPSGLSLRAALAEWRTPPLPCASRPWGRWRWAARPIGR
jgi:SET family sugar efflux transporter-like MFS transporter